MSKHRPEFRKIEPQPPVKPPEPAQPDDSQLPDAPIHRQCPLCFTGEMHGTGVAYSTQGNKRYMKCKECGHTWVVTFRTHIVKIEHRTIELNERKLT
jgi:DNA-directed RNA polymerase subunit RPC12/RpoP